MTTLLRLPDVLNRTKLSRSRLYELLADNKFPAPVKLGGKILAFSDKEIEEWIEARLAER